ncbi:hypothetical protein PIROE2DRAFT_31589, partial [Piromyces sp. E2]
GTTGLSNLGNTCFMNSGLQCIAHTTLLRDYLLKGYWKKELNLTSIHGMKGKMVKAFVKVLENLWGENSGPFRPTEFKSVISKHTPSFEGYHQHDCQEFIASLLDGLHEDINRVPVKKFEEYPDMNKMEDMEAAKTSWDLHIRRENSIIVDLFYGQYRSINICQTCNTKRLNFEPFVYLTLPIPENQEIEVPIQVLLNECIDEFIKEEILTDENKWFCPECKEDREAYKKMDIWKAPEILIVHLKRFIQDRRYYSSRKNNVLVKFPIEGLDLTNIIIGPKSEEKYIYNLYAISNHSGSTGGGHYTAYVKNNGRWYDCNDSFVSETSESSIVTSSAYLLFYE